jgi:hypothetical protein
MAETSHVTEYKESESSLLQGMTMIIHLTVAAEIEHSATVTYRSSQGASGTFN